MTTPAPRPRKRSIASTLPAQVKAAIAAAQDKKAHDVVLLDLRQASAFTDFFVICTGTNSRQVQAIAEAIETAVAKKGSKPALVEGLKTADWVLMDYFDFVVHVFAPATREFYGLERLWADAQRIEIPA
ncbi:MAG: ribosome silencing factor [Acidobacteria bacterium]|nr:ribosome silencing factor [Acidobacteriota bacterium]